MKLNKQNIIDELSLKPFGTKGWLSSNEVKCLVCGKDDKFGILFTQSGAVTHCFRECGNNLSLFRYLQKIGRDDLLDYEREVSLSKKITPLKEAEEMKELPEVELPKGFTRVYFDSYLQKRNFKSYQYEQFEVGITNHFLEKKLHGNLIFVLKQHGKRVGWLSRSKRSKEWHKQNLAAYKEGEGDLVLRYRNSENTDFDKILGGFDEITDNTHTVILVEGIFDKTNTSNLLKTNESEELKVLFTFGDSCSADQIKLLRTTKVKNIILMYDPSTIRQSKKYSTELSKWFNVDVCEIKDENIDPGNIDSIYLSEILFFKKNFLYFYNSKIETKLKA